MLLHAQVTAWPWEMEEQSVAAKGEDADEDQGGGIQGNFDHSALHSFDRFEGVNSGLKWTAFSSLYWW